MSEALDRAIWYLDQMDAFETFRSIEGKSWGQRDGLDYVDQNVDREWRVWLAALESQGIRP